MDLTDKVVAVTGAARGIGRATAEAFLERGAKVAIGDLDAELAHKTAAELAAAPGARVAGFALDVCDANSFAAFLDDAEAELGVLDVIVNNAGIMPTGRFLDEPQGTTDRLIDINVHGVLNGSRLSGRRFAARGTGHIVNVASLAGVHAEAGAATYCGTKHFVVGFTDSLYRELRGYGVGVTCVLPGIINTELSAGTKVPKWARRLSTAQPADVAAGVVRAVERDRVRVVVPASLGAVVKSISWLPMKTRIGLLHAVNFDDLIGGADPQLRAAYHQRLARQTR
jgi:short-subunit dehydrogenase